MINQAGSAGRDAGTREPPAGQPSFAELAAGREVAGHQLHALRPVVWGEDDFGW
jgi:hypothetical protein